MDFSAYSTDYSSPTRTGQPRSSIWLAGLISLSLVTSNLLANTAHAQDTTGESLSADGVEGVESVSELEVVEPGRVTERWSEPLPEEVPIEPYSESASDPEGPPVEVDNFPATVEEDNTEAAHSQETDRSKATPGNAIAEETATEFQPPENFAAPPIQLQLERHLERHLPNHPVQAETHDNLTELESAGIQESAPIVVFGERSTGCQTVLQPGHNLPTSLCSQTHASGLPNPWQSQINGLTGHHFVNSAFADAVGTFGNALPPIPESPVEVAVHSLGEMLQPSLNVLDYYARTIRPQARTGNNDRAPLFPLAFAAPITSNFGWRIHPIFGTLRMHTGLDLGADWGTPVHAALSGRVMIADFLDGYGLTVVLQHDAQDQETLYGHLSEVFVQPGEWLEQGEVLGRVGSTGNSTGPHLHFEVRQWTAEGWVALNPRDKIDPITGELIAEHDHSHGELKAAQVTSDLLRNPETPLGRAIVWFLTTVLGHEPA